jgi:hypothetical protein
MSRPTAPLPAKLVIGFFLKDRSLAGPVSDALRSVFGPIDVVSRWLPFNYTAYYSPEIGNPLFRRMLAFSNLIQQDSLGFIKKTTNNIEDQFAVNRRRRVNIDPGYLLPERFVLASGKNFTHRIYLGQGIYGDLTLIYTKSAFQLLPWTYPDYADENMLAYLGQVRDKYKVDLDSRPMPSETVAGTG